MGRQGRLHPVSGTAAVRSDPGGAYAGFYPSCSLSAVVHLEALRSRGADAVKDIATPTTGRTTKAPATCKSQSGEFDVALVFTLKDDDTVDFLEESSNYKSVLYRCPEGQAGK